MGILQLPTPLVGQEGLKPSRKPMVVTDNLATFTAAGYLNTSNLQGFVVSPSDVIYAFYSFDLDTLSGTYGEFTVAIADNGVITLSQISTGAEVLPPFNSNFLLVYNDGSGEIRAVDPLVSPPITPYLQIGYTGVTGVLVLKPTGANSGQLTITPTPLVTGNFVTTFTNANNQANNVTISAPPVLVPTAKFLVDSAANTMQAGSSLIMSKSSGIESGQLLTLNGQCGTIVTGALTTVAGASYDITWTNTFLNGGSGVSFTITGGTNTTKGIDFVMDFSSGNVLSIQNNHPTAALNGTLSISYLIF